MRIASLVSGGKDSVYASHVAQQRGWNVTHYVTIHPEAADPMLYHKPNVDWVRLQAGTADVAHVKVSAPEGEAGELAALRRALETLDVDGVTSGALASEYQRVRIERVCHDLGLRSFAPLWHHDPVQHLRDLLGAGVEALVVHVAAEGLGKDWLGRPLDERAVQDLERLQRSRGLHPAGEGGEYETFVLDAPQFSQRIQVEESEAYWKRDAGTFHIRKARLEFKSRGGRV